MESRRDFLKASAAALTVAATRPLVGMAGGQRSDPHGRHWLRQPVGRVFDSFSRAGKADCQFVAAAEVNKAKLEQWMTPARQTFKLETVVGLPPDPRSQGRRCGADRHA